MIGSEPGVSGGTVRGAIVPDGTVSTQGGLTAAGEPTDGPVMTLRGAGVDVDGPRVAWVVVGICLVALVASIVLLVMAGIEKNAQISRFHQGGVVVEATVSGCIGLMGGSGSNLVGYDCRAAFTIDGHHYDEAIAR